MPTRTAAPPLALALLPALLLPAVPARAQAETSSPLVFVSDPYVNPSTGYTYSGLYVDPSTGYTYGPTLDLPYTANPGGSYVISNDTLYSPTNVDTPVSVTNDTFSTTVDALLDGRSVFSATFDGSLSDPAGLAAIAQADARLAADDTDPGSPTLASSALTSQVSAPVYVQTGQAATGQTAVTSIDTFGPVTLSGPYISVPTGGYSPPGLYGERQFNENTIYDFFVLPGQLDTNVQTVIYTDVYRTVTTTTTNLTTRTYDITGTPRAANAVPEPGSLALLALGLLPVGLLARRRRCETSR